MKPIEVQISAFVQAPRNGRRIPDSIIREAIVRRASTGEDVPGIDLKIVQWRHGPTAPWHQSANSPDDWARFARFLPSASFRVFARR